MTLAPQSTQACRIFSILMYIGSGIATLVFIGTMAAGLHFYNKAAEQRETWTPAKGTVAEVRTETDNDGDTLYRCVYRFTTQKGEETEVTARIASNPAGHAVGDEVRILYPEGAAQYGKEDTFQEFLFIPVVLLCMGGMDGLFALGLFIGAFYLRRKARQGTL